MPRHTSGTKRASFWCLAASAAMVAGMTATTPATADPSDGRAFPAAPGPRGDVRPVEPNYNKGHKLPLDKKASAESLARSSAAERRSAATASGNAAVGESKTWLALDDVEGGIYKKTYTLRGLGDHIQVWVADDRAFPGQDCRNTLGLTDITDEQVNNFVHEFDTNMYPKESESFSVPPARDGSKSLASELDLPADYYTVESAQSDDIVVLVDNVRDSNYYTPTAADGQTYIAGFFYSTFNEYVDRNVMTIDAFDWLHRTGATPPDNEADADYKACSTALGGRALGGSKPHMYEGTFAHEYQHLLEYYEDPDEASWVNEGLSDYAQTLVGYVDTKVAVDKPEADGHLKCFAGYQAPSFGGPENSLTVWQDQGAPEILCDYGAAYAFMEYLDSKFGEKFLSALHREDANGFAGLDKVLDEFGSKDSAMDILHKWAVTAALDNIITGARRTLTGAPKGPYTASMLNMKINWSNPQAYNSPGAPANGSDYVRLRNGAGTYLPTTKINSIRFKGSTTLAPTPVKWTVDSTPPDATTSETTCDATGTGTGSAALYSGCAAGDDRSIVRNVTVPAGGGQLSFDAMWDFEPGWDAGFAQISTDGGKTWTSLATEDTTTEHDPGAVEAVVSQLPGLTGDSAGWKTQHADLSAYAGQSVLLGFRSINDPGVEEAGMWVRNINVAGTAVPATLDGWRTISQVNPPKVQGYTVQLIGYNTAGRAYYKKLPLDASFSGRLTQAQIKRYLGGTSTTVAAIVMQDDPTETITQQANYTLVVNGVLQPGGK